MMGVFGHRLEILALSTFTSLIFLNISCSDVNPELVFDGKHIVLFPTDTLKDFYKCLCNNTKTVCRYKYVYGKNNDTNYKVDRKPTVQIDDINQGDVGGSNFICHSEPFEKKRGFLSCTRSSYALNWCSSKTYCQPFCVTLSEDKEYNDCKFYNINMIWITTELKSKNFKDVPTFKKGPCKDRGEPPTLIATTSQTTPQDGDFTESIQTTEITSPDNIVTINPLGQNSSNSDSKTATVALALGWILFTSAVVIIVVLSIYLYRKRKSDPKKPILKRSASRPNAYTGNSANSTSGGRDQTSDARHPWKDVNDYDYYTVYGLNQTDYNIIDEGKVTGASKKISKANSVEETSPGHGDQDPGVDMPKAETTARFGYSFAGQPANAGNKEEEVLEREGEINHGYMILEADSDSQNSKGTDGDLGTHNLASVAPTNNHSDSTVSGPPPTDQKDTNSDNGDASRDSLNLTDYDKLKNGKLYLRSDQDAVIPDTYNTGSTLFEERDKIGGVGDGTEPTVSAYDFPKQQEGTV